MINTGKKYAISFLVGITIVFGIIIAITYVFDPYFHYHRPYDWVTYTMNNQRYQNYGIVDNFEYDAIITGSSMTDNFKTSEFDKLFSVKSIKIPVNGARFKEINEILKRALDSHNVGIVIRSLDIYFLLEDKDAIAYNEEYPTYLYDDNIFNDVKYIFNKTTFFNSTLNSIIDTINKKESTTFDFYSSWYQTSKYGKEALDEVYERPRKINNIAKLSNNEKKTIEGNLMQNVISTAVAYPETDFYYFLPPYSIYWWDYRNQVGNIKKMIDVIEYSIELLTKYENIHIYSFISEYDIVTNLNNYRDITHYNEKINSKILLDMKNGTNRITSENYKEYIKEVTDWYINYDYDELFSQ